MKVFDAHFAKVEYFVIADLPLDKEMFFEIVLAEYALFNSILLNSGDPFCNGFISEKGNENNQEEENNGENCNSHAL